MSVKLLISSVCSSFLYLGSDLSTTERGYACFNCNRTADGIPHRRCAVCIKVLGWSNSWALAAVGVEDMCIYEDMYIYDPSWLSSRVR